MEKKQTFFTNITSENLSVILCSMSNPENQQKEMIFPVRLIENICKEKQYPCYKFAYNLEGHIYMRARMNHITLEYLVRPSMENPNQKEACVFQIVKNCERIYYKPDYPIGTIYVS